MKHIIVLGYQLDGQGEAQPILLDRMRAALNYYHQCLNSAEKVQMIFSGGNAKIGAKKQWSESMRMKHIALHPEKYGININPVKINHINEETASATTIQNIMNLISENCFSNKGDQAIIITSAFHQPRVAKFVELMKHYFSKLIGSTSNFDIIVKGDEKAVTSTEDLRLHEKREKILMKTFLDHDQVCFVNELKTVFKKQGFRLKPLLHADEINFISACNGNKLNLSLMHIDNNTVDDDFIKRLILFLKQQKIKNLDISGNDFGDKIVCNIIDGLISNEISLSKLNLDSNQLTDESLPQITELLQSNYCPHNLNLGNNKLGQNEIFVSQFKPNSRLVNLSLFKNENITDNWLNILLAQLQWSNIRSLNLQHCLKKGIKNKQKIALTLKKLIKNNDNFIQLYIADCGFNDQMMQELHTILPKLKSFHVYGNELTNDGVDLLLESIANINSKITTATWFGHLNSIV